MLAELHPKLLRQILVFTCSLRVESLHTLFPIAVGRHATRGGAFGAFDPPEIFKTLHSNFDICRNFQRLKMKFCILIIFRKPYLNFSLSCSSIISLQDLS